MISWRLLPGVADAKGALSVSTLLTTIAKGNLPIAALEHDLFSH